jgi:hypothetical protein
VTIVKLGQILILAGLLGVTQATNLSAQVIPGMLYSGSLESYYQSWEITEGESTTKINQLIVPVNVFLPVSDKADVRIGTSYASFGREVDGLDSESVSGLTDIRLQANYAALDRRLLVSLIANLPTGKGELTSSQQDVVFDFVSPDLSVRANRLGEGFNVGGTVNFAEPLSHAAILSIGAGLIVRGAYDTGLPTSETSIRLAPGLLMNGSAGIDFFTGPSHLHLSSTFSYYGTEQVDDLDYYRIGPEFALRANYGVSYSRSKGMFTAGLHQILRLDNSSSVGGTFDTEPISTNGSYLAISAANEYAVTPIILVDVSAVARIVGKNDFDVGNSTVFEGGLGFTVLAAENVSVSLGGRYISGSGTGFTGLDRDLSGLEGAFRLAVHLPQ